MSKESTRQRIGSSYIINGIMIMILSTIIFFYTSTALIFIIYIFTFIILLSGISRVNVSINNEKLSNIGKATKFISGFVLIIISFVIFITTLGNPSTSTDLLIFLLTIGLIIVGIARVGTGVVNQKFIKWFRIFLVIVGSITIVVNLIIVIAADLDTIMAIYLIATSLFINGFTRFLYGLTGTEKFSKRI
ncbi:MAG: hypothetical protein KGD72_07425 [Candidatus Lokiarchaeota archaeon]|nr:hypothetical protein [Candidatus Lokiarchaeota archaeon]